MDDTHDCPACHATNATMGRLGKLLHYCCRYCGLWYVKDES